MQPLLRLLAATVAVLVLLPSAAQAKELMSVQVCGRDECVRIRDRDLLAPGLIHGSLVARPPAREPFARLVMHIGDGREVVARERSAFLPRAGLYRLRTGQWFRPGEAAVAALRRITATLALVPAERLQIARPREPMRRRVRRRRPRMPPAACPDGSRRRPRRCWSRWPSSRSRAIRRAPAG